MYCFEKLGSEREKGLREFISFLQVELQLAKVVRPHIKSERVPVHGLQAGGVFYFRRSFSQNDCSIL